MIMPILDIRDLYELLLRNDGSIPSSVTNGGLGSFTHQLERKGGRQPNLRLRFGKRSEGVFGSFHPDVDPRILFETDKMSR
jgi:hypothetical protein